MEFETTPVAQDGDQPEYPLGFKPRAWLFVDGQPLWARRIGPGATTQAVGYHAAISRVEYSLGLDMVGTLTVTVVGEEAAKLVGRIDKRTPIRLEVGYEDHPETRQRVFDGHAIQAYPSGTNPVTVDLEADTLMYQAREDRGAAANTDENKWEFIKSRLAAQPTPITTNLEGIIDAEQDEGGKQEGSLLDLIQKWTEDNFVHWLDLMTGAVRFFYPGEKHDLYRPWRTWSLSVRSDRDPAILTEWGLRQSFVESPREITAVYYLEDADDLTPNVVTATNELGLEDSTLHLGNFYVKSQAEAQAIVNAAADAYYWQAVEGDFTLSVGLPIMPLDEIVARNPPPGLEYFYDRPFEVTRVKHVLDERGWTTTGKVRGGRGT